jgi:transcriptional regulator with XRE-family HTH domain
VNSPRPVLPFGPGDGARPANIRDMVDPGNHEIGARIAANRDRQRELYGAPLGDRVRRLTGLLDVSQARLARALGISPAMLSQLAGGRRVKIGDPSVLARMLVLEQRCRGMVERPSGAAVEALLADVARADWRWAQWAWSARGSAAGRAVPGRPARPAHDGPRSPADALRGVAEPARLAAAAAALGPAFPELAEVLRQAAGRPRPVRSN